MCHTCINISVQYILFSIGEVNVRVDEVVGAESTSDHKEMENSNQVYMYIPLSVSHTVEVHIHIEQKCIIHIHVHTSCIFPYTLISLFSLILASERCECIGSSCSIWATFYSLCIGGACSHTCDG